MKKILAAFVLCFGLFTQLLAQEVTETEKKEAPAKKFAFIHQVNAKPKRQPAIP